MNDVEKISEAVDTLTWLQEQLDGIPPDAANVEMALHLLLAKTYLVECAVHRKHGKGLPEAVAAAARGELDISKQVDDYRKSLN